jgi:hypothetical protein
MSFFMSQKNYLKILKINRNLEIYLEFIFKNLFNFEFFSEIFQIKVDFPILISENSRINSKNSRFFYF